MRAFRLLLIVAFALGWAGCRSTRPLTPIEADLPDAFPNHSAEQITARLAMVSDTLQAFTGRGNLTFESPKMNGRFSATVNARRGDSLYMSLSPGLGIEAGRLLITPDSIFLYNRIERELTTGSLDEAGGLLAMPLEGETLFRNMIGFVVPEADVRWTVAADSATYVLRSPDGTRAYTIDPALWRVVRYEERTRDGDLLEERLFSTFDVIEGVYIPRRVVFRRPDDEVLAAFYYRDLDLTPGDLAFDLRVSGDAQRVPLGR